MRGKIHAPDDYWAVDGPVLTPPGDRLYFLWAGGEGETNGQQNLYIAPMSDPFITVPDPLLGLSGWAASGSLAGVIPPTRPQIPR